MTATSPQLIGVSASLRRLQEDIRQAACSDAKILITGESGVGKEVAARLVHAHSGRRTQPFCAVNCGGVADSLLESELFGHTRGSFTGAYRDATGLLEQADGGTLFMDEVGETSLRMQAALLRFLESGEIQRVGAGRPSARLNVRVIAATNRELVDRVAANAFREDLYYRLNVIHLIVPPLRARRDDIEPLVLHFLRELSARQRQATPELSPRAMNALTRHDWPGNVRELRNFAERSIVHGCEAALRMQGITPALPAHAAPAWPAAPGATTPAHATETNALYQRMVHGKGSFWTVVYQPFMARDLTRADVQLVVNAGLAHTHGNYKALVQLFNMAPGDYKKFLQFLHTHRCFTPFEHYRAVENKNVETDRRAIALPRWTTAAQPPASS